MWKSKAIIRILAMFVLVFALNSIEVFSDNFIIGQTNNDDSSPRNETIDDCSTFAGDSTERCFNLFDTVFDGPTNQGRAHLGYLTPQLASCDVSTVIATLNLRQKQSERTGVVGAYFVNWTWNDPGLIAATDKGRTGTAGEVDAEFIESVAEDSITVDGSLIFFTWNVTSGVRRSITEGVENVSFYMVGTEDGDDGSFIRMRFDAWNVTTSTDRHFLNVTCDLDTFPPVIKLGINNTSPKVNEDIDISFNVTDATAPINGNITINFSTGTTISNYTFTGNTNGNNITTITDIGGNVLNISVCFTDALDNYACNSTKITIVNTAPTLSNNITNNSVPRINDVVMFNVTINDSDGTISGYIFSWENGTGSFVNDSFISVEDLNSDNVNVSVNKTIVNVSGTRVEWRWYANDSNGDWVEGGVEHLIVAGTTPPTLTINLNNFFSSDNKTIISLNQSQNVLLNFTFTDDIDLFGFEINITNSSGDLIYNLTNTALSGTVDNFTVFINVSGLQGFYDVSVEMSDTHTEFAIPDYDIRKGFNYLQYNNKIRITAEGAIWSSTKKFKDRYNFQFNYLPLIGPKIKVFYVESDSELYYIRESSYKAHFVDFKNKKWIDFEGIGGEPRVTKISSNKWRIEFDNEDSKVIFSSIGGLNRDVVYFQYYLSNPEVNWFEPTTTENILGSDSVTVSLNVTGNGRNRTEFRLYNSSNDEVQGASVTNNGTGTYFYNVTFSDLIDTTYFINATHTDVNGENTSSTTLTFSILTISDGTLGFPAINFTLIDEVNSSRIVGDTTGTFTYNDSSPTKTHTVSELDRDNFTISIFPAGERITADYTLTYSATGYQERVFSVDGAILTNNTQTINLELLQDTVGIFATFKLIDSFQKVLTDVEGTMKTAANETIEVRSTDDAGIVTFFVDPDTTYEFTFVKSGFKTNTFSLRITSTDIITITMEEEVIAEQESESTGIDYYFLPSNQVLINMTDYDFVFNMTSSFWNITGCSLELRNTSTSLNKSETSFNGSICDITISFNTGNQTLIISEATYQLNGTMNNTVSVQYSVIYTFQGTFSLKTFFDDIAAFSEAGFNDFTRMFLALIITFSVVGFASSESVGIRDAESLVILAWGMVLFFSAVGWFTLNYEAIPEIRGLATGWLKQWIIFILFSLGGGSFILRRHTT